jgi:hypothetical protein
VMAEKAGVLSFGALRLPITATDAIINHSEVAYMICLLSANPSG